MQNHVIRLQIPYINTCGFLATTVAVLMMGNPISAADLVWLNTAGGPYFFDAADNWSPTQQPTASDDVYFSADVGPDPIIVGPSSAAGSVHVTKHDWVFTGTAGGTLTTGGLVDVSDAAATSFGDAVTLGLTDNLTWNSADSVAVGRSGYGRLTLDGGSEFTANRVYVGDGADSVGEITLTGPGTTLAASLLNVNSGLHLIGYRGGTGVMNVMAGAQLRTLSNNANDITVGGFVDSVGTLNIDGVGSLAETEDLLIGQLGGTGYLNITNGGQAINTDGGSPDTYFGLDVGSRGTGVVEGNGSLLSSRSVFVGYDGVGRLEVRGGGEVRTVVDSTSPSDMHIGMVAGSDGRGSVYGTAPFGLKPSLLNVHGTLFVGGSGLGHLYVGLDLHGNEVGGGAVQVGRDLSIGEDFGNTNDNRMIVSGPQASVEVQRYLVVGDQGKASLEISNGAVVTSSGGRIGVRPGPGAAGVATIDGSGSLWHVSNIMILGEFGGDGTLHVTNGATLATGETRNHGKLTVTAASADFGSGLGNDGQLWLENAQTAGRITNRGQMTVADINHATSIDLTSDGEITFGLDGGPGNADRLELVGDAKLAGALSITASNPTSVELGDEFVLVLAGLVTGEFDSATFPFLNGSLTFKVVYDPDRVYLQAVAVVAGDYNADGIVSQSDLDLVLLSWGGHRATPRF